MLSILLALLLAPHNLLHLELIRHIRALLDRRALLNRLEPNLHLRERRLARVHARPLAPVRPAEDADVRRGVLVGDEEGGLRGGEGEGGALRGEPVVEHAVEAPGFGLVAVYRIGDFFGGVCEGVQVRVFDPWSWDGKYVQR